MKKTCAVSKKEFEITEKDLKFYEKMGVPTPTLCGEERTRRRLAWRNERKLYHRKCDLTGKQIITNFGKHTDIVIYDQEAWWSDMWDAKDYGRDFDFSHTFFEQFQELQKEVPQLALSVWNSENSTYCNYVGNVRNSYLIFGSVYSEDCLYGSPYYSKNCVDNLLLRDCEWCYECVDCRKLYECFYCQDCHSSNNLVYCFDLQGCHDCIGCAGLRRKEYCIFNKQYSRAEYEELKKNLDLSKPEQHQKIKSELQKLKLEIPHRFMQGNQFDNSCGNYIYQAKNINDSYYVDKSEDCAYCAQVVDLKDCYDNNFTEENELCCEYLGAYQNKFLGYSKFCNKVSEAFYCDSCFVSQNLFGCIGIRNSQYCILNKQYSKEEYEKLKNKIIEHMKETGEWGEFFPIEMSPFAYNETIAQEYFPLSKEEILKRGWTWKGDEDNAKYDGPKYEIPSKTEDVNDEILEKILTCECTGKNYRIVKSELDFYRKMNLPIPSICPDARHEARMKLRNPRKLWERKCDKCGISVKTTFSLDRPEKVYCEKCYLEHVH